VHDQKVHILISFSNPTIAYDRKSELRKFRSSHDRRRAGGRQATLAILEFDRRTKSKKISGQNRERPGESRSPDSDARSTVEGTKTGINTAAKTVITTTSINVIVDATSCRSATKDLRLTSQLLSHSLLSFVCYHSNRRHCRTRVFSCCDD
jgi:hypothetical protein